MYLNPENFKSYSWIFSLVPVIVSVIMYWYVALKVKDSMKMLILIFCAISLFFLSIFLIAERDTVFPATGVWIINQKNSSLIKTEMVSLFQTSYIFRNKTQSFIRPYETLAVINDTDKELYVDVNMYSTSKPDQLSLAGFLDILASKKNKIRIKPYSVGYTMKLNYFGYGKEKPPKQKMITYTKNRYDYYDQLLPRTEVTYWLRW